VTGTNIFFVMGFFFGVGGGKVHIGFILPSSVDGLVGRFLALHGVSRQERADDFDDLFFVFSGKPSVL
jgi:hypothetical protein